jgi:hypothetical protein
MAADDSGVLLIQTEGGGTEGVLEDLEEWLGQEEELRVRRTMVSSADDTGTKLSATAVLIVILGTPAAVAAVNKLGDALIAWIKATRPQTKITVREGDRSITIDTNAPPSKEQLAEMLQQLKTAS